MAVPWEKYSTASSSPKEGPWGKYAGAGASVAAPLEKSTSQVLLENLPFGTTVQDIAKSQNPYTATPEGVGRAAGDIGTMSGLGAATMMFGGPVVATGVGLGALAGTALEKTGVSPWFREKGQEIRESRNVPNPLGMFPGISKTFEQRNFPSKVAGIPGLGQMLNLGQEGLKEAAATTVDLVPSGLAAFLSGLGMKGIQSGVGRAAKGPAPLPGGAGLLEEAGVTVTPAMKKFAETGQRRGVPAAVEDITRINPLTAGMMERIGKSVEKAITQKVGAIPGAEMTTPLATGGALSKVMESFQKRRGSAVGAAKDAIRAIDQGDVGQLASKRIIGQLEKGGVPFDEGGFNVELMKGGERMSPATAQTLIDAERDLRGMTLGQAVNYLDNFDAIHGQKLSAKYGNAATNAIKEARGLIKSTILESAPDNLARALTEADRAYAISQPVVKPFLESARGMQSDASLAGKLFGKAGSKADKSLRRLKTTMEPGEWSQVQDSLASEVLQRAGGVEKMSLAKLKTALKELGENRQFLKPEAIKALEEAAMMMETANVVELGLPNPPGTASRIGSQLGTVGGVATLGGLVSSAIPLSGYLGSSGATAAYMKAPSAIRGLQRTIQPMAQRVTVPNATGVAAGAGLGTAPATLREAMLRNAKRLALKTQK